MVWIDIAIIVIVIGLIIHGIATGLIRGAFDIAGIIFGYVLAAGYSATVNLPQILAFLLIFIVVMVAFSIAGRIVSKIIHITPLGLIDRVLGGILGVAKGLIICFVFLLALMFIKKDSRALSRSQFAPQIVNLGINASRVLPRSVHEWIEGVFFRRDIASNNEDHHLPV
ncbi:CvpA family protein [candidate division WOR-3 bacterium]|nr:CvpA family protein [candidate division WOR-3 bacterium]